MDSAANKLVEGQRVKRSGLYGRRHSDGDVAGTVTEAYDDGHSGCVRWDNGAVTHIEARLVKPV